MEGQGLSQGERRTLYAMEEALRLEATTLDRRLRTMRPRLRYRLAELADRPLTYLVLSLGAMSVMMLVLGIRTSSVGVVWAFSGCWTVTLLAAVGLVRDLRGGVPRR